MTTDVSHIGSHAVQVIIGVDTHKDRHVAVAIDGRGVRLDEKQVPVAVCGYEELERWSRDLGHVNAFGVEGTGSYGAGLARFLADRGYTVLEVNRPDRSIRYRKGKSDPTDAEMAARSVLAGVADATPKSGEGEVEMIRMLKSTKSSAVKARTQAVNQMKALVRAIASKFFSAKRKAKLQLIGLPKWQVSDKRRASSKLTANKMRLPWALVVTAPAELREKLDGLGTSALVKRCGSFRPGRLDSPTAAAKYALRSLACRYRQLSKEIQDLKAELERLIQAMAPALVEAFGVGSDTAAALLIAAGSNPDRLNSEAAFASLCGVNPIPVPASSGRTNRHRLNRGGDRQANAALYRIVVVRLRHDLRTQAYLRRRTAEGMSKTEVIRCLKRYVAREVYSIIRKPNQIIVKAA